MNNDLYARQEMLDLSYIPIATVVGLGGTGTWVAIFLAMSGTGRLYFMDTDRLEMSNFNRLPFPPETMLNEEKVEAVRSFIRSIRPDCLTSSEGRANNFTLSITEGVIFDCTDNLASQTLISNFAKSSGRRYIRVGYDGTHMTVTSRSSSWKTKDTSGYEITPSWVVPAALAACLGVAKAMYSSGLEIHHDICELVKGV